MEVELELDEEFLNKINGHKLVGIRKPKASDYIFMRRGNSRIIFSRL